MITVRQIERLWQTGEYERVARSCLEMRPENSLRLVGECAKALPAAALAIIRLDELSQAYVPFCGRLVQTILASQEPDGGWRDPFTTALCLRALMCGHGDGGAIDRGMQYLADLQKTDGSWPKAPIRRLASDAFTSAFILFQLGDDFRFRQAVRLGDALHWFAANESTLDGETARLWRILSTRQRLALRQQVPVAN